MRILSWTVLAAVLLLVTISWWHRPLQPTADAHATIATTHDGVAMSAPMHGDHQFGATAAVRFPHHRDAYNDIPSAAHAARELDRAASAVARRENSNADLAHEREQTLEPRPAGELFVPFIADDPKQVFLSATAQYHSALQGETQDPEWGPAAADALRGYVAAQFGDRFEIPYVDCRQDLCELQVAGRIGADLQSDMRDIQAAMSRMQQQPWWSTLQFDQESGTVGSSQDGRVLLLWFFSRK